MKNHCSRYRKQKKAKQYFNQKFKYKMNQKKEDIFSYTFFYQNDNYLFSYNRSFCAIRKKRRKKQQINMKCVDEFSIVKKDTGFCY